MGLAMESNACNGAALFNKYPLTSNKMSITSLLIFHAISTSRGLLYSKKLGMVVICPRSLYLLSTGFINDLSSVYLSLCLMTPFPVLVINAFTI